MIFVTVGTQLPFDRLIRAIDKWAEKVGRSDVFAQVGPTNYQPRHIESSQFLDAQAFRQHVADADVVIAHAGMGSIITALEMGKPIIVMPRSAALGEHRNEHQAATAKRFLAQGRIVVAFDEKHLIEKLEQLNTFRAADRIASTASPKLLATIRSFVTTGQVPVFRPDGVAVGLEEGIATEEAPEEATGIDMRPTKWTDANSVTAHDSNR